MQDLVATLKALPPDTPITTGQLAALLEGLLDAHRQKLTPPGSRWDGLPDHYEITQTELSEWIRKAPSTLEKLRGRGTGPAYKPGKPVLYRVGDVKEWLASRKVSSTSDATVRGIHRLESLADLFPVFRFEQQFPMGLEDALDYQEANPEAEPTEVVFFNRRGSARTKKSKVIDEMDLALEIFEAQTRIDDGKEKPLAQLRDWIDAHLQNGVELNDLKYEDGGNLAHALFDGAEALTNVDITNQLLARNETINLIEELEAEGLNIHQRNDLGLTPLEVASPESSVANYFKARDERDKYAQAIPPVNTVPPAPKNTFKV